MSESQQSISLWARSTFGDADVRVIVLRALQEGVELVEAVFREEPYLEEVADNWIMLVQVLEKSDLDVEEILENHTAVDIQENTLLGCASLVLTGWAMLMTDDFDLDNGVLVTMVLVLQHLGGEALVGEVERKMRINRNRDWALKNGHHHHVR